MAETVKETKIKEEGLENKPLDVKKFMEVKDSLIKEDRVTGYKYSKFGPENIFAFHYRARFRPTEDIIVARDIQEARQLSIDYCNRFGITFISVRPFILDLKKKPRDNLGRQPEADKE